MAGLVFGAGAVLGGCGFLTTTFPTYRFRLTIDIDTPLGRRSGSSVYEVRTSKTGRNFPASPNQVSYTVRGEALVVDLASGALFAVLSDGFHGNLMIHLNEALTDWVMERFPTISQRGM